jgi:outer membrane protein assembly factor BamD
MKRFRILPVARALIVVAAALSLLTSCGFKRKKYENPITKNTQQPDKVLFDKAINDIERGRYEVARLTLNTLINTYDTSEFLAKAKLAIADSWFREGGGHALAQAEAEYKDFILFYPTMEESAEAQQRVCMIHVKQMEKADRDPNQALRAEDECRQLLVQFPNSKFAPRAQQLLREIQEVIGENEYRVGVLYHNKGAHPAAANRFQSLVDHYPLYSKADDALWELGDSYTQMGPRVRDKAGQAYSRIVKDYPLSGWADAAKQRLKEMELPIPEADPVAYARMKYEMENRVKPGMMSHAMGVFRKNPDTSMAAKSGTPAMTALRPGIPVTVPAPAAIAAPSGTTDVTATTVSDSTALDTKPDARQAPPTPDAAKPAAPDGTAGQTAVSADPAAKSDKATTEPTGKKKKKQKKTKKT